MAQAVHRRPDTADPISMQVTQRIKEGILIAIGGVALFLLIALWSHHPSDPGWSHTGAGGPIRNQCGVAGAWVADVSLYLFGQFAFVFPVMIAFGAWSFFKDRTDERGIDYFHLGVRAVGFVLTLAMGCGVIWMHWRGAGIESPHHAGGILGDVVGRASFTIFGQLGGALLMIAVFLTGITLFTGLSWIALMDTTGRYALALIAAARERGDELIDYLQRRRARHERVASVKQEVARQEHRVPPRIEPAVVEVEPSERVEKERQETLFEQPPGFALPPLNLLDAPVKSSGGYSAHVLEAMSRQVELKLRDFGIEVEVVAVHPGPVITRFELSPAPGVKASRITNLSKDLARSLSTISVRVVEVIPGKSVIGLEIPNEQREVVSLSEILKSREYEESSSKLTLVLGKDIGGKPTVVNLARMPHLLVAGTTGSGKSVALNAMILSLLYKSTVADVRLIMIDPKMLELSVYEGIPALLAPVVTDMKEAANALRWCVAEMERRYRLMSALGVRNITGYNRKVEDAAARGKPIADPLFEVLEGLDIDVPDLISLPYIVVVVDELADMMMTVGKKVEELIARLAQKARAAGIHLILATQRPSVDVITGLIKANIPCRIAFQVSSRIDSRTILDQMGAENLLGHGDMLYLPPGTGLPLRVHGAFVSDQEVHKVVKRLKSGGTPDYIADVLTGPAESEDGGFSGTGSAGDEGADELYDRAVRIVTETRRASISGIQRRLKIGYNRAARMVEEMERTGVVGELQSNGSREVLAPPPPKD